MFVYVLYVLCIYVHVCMYKQIFHVLMYCMYVELVVASAIICKSWKAPVKPVHIRCLRKATYIHTYIHTYIQYIQ